MVIAGGVSVGKYDLVPAILEEQGVAVHVRQVRMKPGKPHALRHEGRNARLWAAGQPSRVVRVLRAVRAAGALRVLAGHASPRPITVSLPLAGDFAASNDRPTYHPAKLELGDSGYAVRPLPWAGAPISAAFNRLTCSSCCRRATRV